MDNVDSSGRLSPKDDPYFPTESVFRRVHQERLVGLWALLRAAVLQATHPRAFAIFALHTGPEDQLFRRLADTAEKLERVFFGSRVEAKAVGASTRLLHARMRGEFPPSAPGGLTGRYRADEPELLLWVLECMADSAEAIWNPIYGFLTAEEQEALWQEYITLGALFGLPGEACPGSYADYRAHFQEHLGSATLLKEAREMGRRVVLELPVFRRHIPARAAARLAVVGTLQDEVWELYEFDWSPADRLKFRMLIAGVRTARRHVPAPWTGSCAFAYRNVAAAEAAGR